MTRDWCRVCASHAAERLARIPKRHLFERDAHRLAGVAAEMLVGKEEGTLATREGPLENLGRVRRGADDAAVLAAKPFEGGRGIHIGHGDNRLAARCVWGGAENFFELVPAISD